MRGSSWHVLYVARWQKKKILGLKMMYGLCSVKQGGSENVFRRRSPKSTSFFSYKISHVDSCVRDKIYVLLIGINSSIVNTCINERLWQKMCKCNTRKCDVLIHMQSGYLIRLLWVAGSAWGLLIFITQLTEIFWSKIPNMINESLCDHREKIDGPLQLGPRHKRHF